MEATLLAALAAAAAAINSGLVIWNFLQSPSKKNSQAIETLQKTLDEALKLLGKAVSDGDSALERRIQSIEGELRHLPSKDAVNDLKLAISELKGSVGRLEERLAPISSTVNHIDTYLREGEKS